KVIDKAQTNRNVTAVKAHIANSGMKASSMNSLFKYVDSISTEVNADTVKQTGRVDAQRSASIQAKANLIAKAVNKYRKEDKTDDEIQQILIAKGYTLNNIQMGLGK
ncbi:MAG: hypothetical protein KAG66_07635, partial [Methylococcales bacterium]|nr:hypothetical protein [Methylococcales bacterium]